MTQGVHEWTLKIEQDVDGSWVGVASPSLTLGRDTTPQSIDPANSKVWWWKSAGQRPPSIFFHFYAPLVLRFTPSGSALTVYLTRFYLDFSGATWQNFPSTNRNVDSPFARGQVIKLRLDCERGELSFFQSPSATVPMRTLTGVTGPVVPFVYFDYDSQVELLSATTIGVASGNDGGPQWVSDQTGVKLCSQLSSRSMHAVYHRMTHEPSSLAARSRNDAVALAQVSQVLGYARRITKFVRDTVEASGGSDAFELSSDLGRSPSYATRRSRSPGWAYHLLESSQLQALLGTALALATVLIPRRKPDGESIGAALLPDITATIASLQTAFDSVPQMLMDPSTPLRQAAREFASAQACDLTTAEYYIFGCGSKAQAVAEYERESRSAAPDGFRPPCDDAWLAEMVDALSGLGGKCVASLCTGLKDEEEFDVSLLGPVAAPVEAGSSAMEKWVEEISSIRQRWIGFPAPALREVENLSIVAMVCVSGLLGNASTETDAQGALLHCGKEALKVKNSVQTAYRERSESEEPATWESVSEDLQQRAYLLLEFGAAVGSVPELLAPEDEDGIGHLPEEVIVWQQTNDELDERCRVINSARKFLIEGPKAEHVREVLAARRVALHDAECGYSGALSLVEAGILDDDTGLKRSPTVAQPELAAVSGSWHLTLDGDGGVGAVSSQAITPCCLKVSRDGSDSRLVVTAGTRGWGASGRRRDLG